jgi:hypothetical protein
MALTCLRLREDPDLNSHGVEAYVLSDHAEKEHEIESGALIEKRNRESFGVLVAFIPQGLHLPAEDSYDIHTFKTYDLAGVLRSHSRTILSELSDPIKSIASIIMDQPAVKRQPIDRQIKYLLALRDDGAGWGDAGAYLFLLNLISDLRLSEKELETRIDRNRHCVEELSNPDRTILQSIDSLVNKSGLNAKEGELNKNLIRFFRERNVTEAGQWLKEILTDEKWRPHLTFDKWAFRDIPEEGKVEIHLQPFKDPKTGSVIKGLKEEGSNLVATTSPQSPIHLRWETNPKKPENLGHYLILVVRDTEDEEEELVRRTVKKGRSTPKLSLKDVELDEGETCAAKVKVYAKDPAGIILSSDESESFWIEGGIQVESVSKKVKKIRNRAEAVLMAAHKLRKPIEIDSENWEEGRPMLYRIKLKNREIYRIQIHYTLHEIELKNIRDPFNCGAWQADARNLSVLRASDLCPFPVHFSNVSLFDQFMKERRTLFEAFQDHDPDGIVEVFDLRLFEEKILAYVDAYNELLKEIRRRLNKAQSDGEINNVLSMFQSINRLDTIHLKVGTSEDESEVVLQSPTHPLRVLWVLQYQKLLFYWADLLNGMSEEEANRLINVDNALKIASLNIPFAISFGHGEIFINTDNLDIYWSLFPKGDSPDIRKLNSYIYRLLNIKEGTGRITTVTPEQIADKLWRYLKHHPYIMALKINVINPGDGEIVLNAIRILQGIEEFKNMNYDVGFYGDMRYEMMGNAFDTLTMENLSAEGMEKEVDEELLRPNENPLFPKLLFSKRRIKETDWPQTEVNEAHVTIIIDRFSTKVLTRPLGKEIGSFSLHNLLAEYRASFDIKGDSATWSRKILPNQNQEIRENEQGARFIFEIVDNSLRLSSCFYNWSNSQNEVPAVQLELSSVDKYIISHIHENSDWVLTVDRNFGIEYFDNPRRSEANSYLIDYTPEFLEGLGHRLIVSTYWLSEIEGLIKDGLRKMGIPGTGFHASQILDILKSISGRLALKLINNPKDAREIIGLALTRLLLEEEGELSDSVLIPVDSHVSLFFEHKKQLKDATIRLHRSDLIQVSLKGNTLKMRLIEVKFRTGSGAGEEYSLKEQIVAKNQDTQKVIEERFQPMEMKDRFDRDIQNHELARLIEFYLERCIRHGLIQGNSEGEETFRKGIQKITENDFNISFNRAGFIFNLFGISKEVEEYKGNNIYIIGKDKISHLLEIEEDTIEPSEDEEGIESKEEVEGEEKYPAGDFVETEETETIRVMPAEDEQESKDELIEAKKTQEEETKPSIHKPSLQIRLGKDCDTGKDIYWNPFSYTPKKLTNQHVLIVGTTGAGKTQTASAFIDSLSINNVPSIIFDFQGEYMDPGLVDLKNKTFMDRAKANVIDAADGIPINPFEVPKDRLTDKKLNYQKVVYQVSASLKRIFGLGGIQHAILRDAINQAYIIKGFIPGDKQSWESDPPTLSDVWSILKEKENNEGGNVRNLNLRVQPLFEMGIFTGEETGLTFEDILGQTTIIRLSNLATPELMVVVSRFVLQKIYSDMLAKGPVNNIRVFAVIDEAHKLSYDETLTELVREARKYGVGLLLASQSPKDFNRVAFDLIGTKIALHLEGEDARIMADNLGVINKDQRDIARELILAQPNLRALLRNNHYEPYIQVDITPFFKKS